MDIVERLRTGAFRTNREIIEAADTIQQQAERILELEATHLAEMKQVCDALETARGFQDRAYAAEQQLAEVVEYATQLRLMLEYVQVQTHLGHIRGSALSVLALPLPKAMQP